MSHTKTSHHSLIVGYPSFSYQLTSVVSILKPRIRTRPFVRMCIYTRARSLVENIRSKQRASDLVVKVIRYLSTFIPWQTNTTPHLQRLRILLTTSMTVPSTFRSESLDWETHAKLEDVIVTCTLIFLSTTFKMSLLFSTPFDPPLGISPPTPPLLLESYVRLDACVSCGSDTKADSELPQLTVRNCRTFHKALVVRAQWKLMGGAERLG